VGFLKEAEGHPLKSIALTTSLGTRKGELVVTSYGLEGTPIYAIGKSGKVSLDLKPDLSLKEIDSKLNPKNKENLSPVRRIGKYLKLCEASQALLFHLTTPEQRADLKKMTALIKAFPVTLKGTRPLAEAISSSGGLSWSELNADFMLKKFPGIFAAGEMLDWDAPTGGFLIQGSVSQGYVAGLKMIQYAQSGESS
jgi:predicted flavoprotein YhiN